MVCTAWHPQTRVAIAFQGYLQDSVDIDFRFVKRLRQSYTASD